MCFRNFIIRIIIWMLLFAGVTVHVVGRGAERPENEKAPMIFINDTLYQLYGPLSPSDPVIETLTLTDLRINEVNFKEVPSSEGAANFGVVNMKVYEGKDENVLYVKLKDVYLVFYRIDMVLP